MGCYMQWSGVTILVERGLEEVKMSSSGNAYWMHVVRVSAKGQQTKTSLKVACAYTSMELLRRKQKLKTRRINKQC